jgi:seryl-tRNA synthetase
VDVTSTSQGGSVFEGKIADDLGNLVCATERTLCCILENYQTPEGFNVPEVLRKYIPGNPEFLPFVKEWKPQKDEKGIPERPKQAAA